MVVQKAINNLKEGPKEDKVAVASGVAISVVVVLLVGWAIFFFRNIQSNGQEVNLSGGAQDVFNFTSVKEAQQRLMQEFKGSNEELLQVRDSNASQQMQLQEQSSVQENQNSGPDQFGNQ